MADMMLQAGIKDRDTAGCPTSRAARVAAVLDCLLTRTPSVRIPRINSQASKALKALPNCERVLRICVHNWLSRAVARAPAIKSECPLRYLVAECMTMSAPSDNGRVSIGVATVSRPKNGVDGVSDVGNCRDVGDRPQRVARCLDPNKPSFARSYRGTNRVAVGCLNEGDTVAKRPISSSHNENPNT